MTSRRILLIAYSGLGLYCLVVVALTSLTLGGVLPALVQLFVCGALFVIGYRGRNCEAYEPPASEGTQRTWPSATNFVLSLGVVLSTVSTTLHYTGMSPGAVLVNLSVRRSMYSDYQNYNAELVAVGGGGGLSVWFLMLIVETAVGLTVIFTIVPRIKTASPSEWILVAAVVGAQCYSGVARGTGLEFFQVGSALLVAILSRPRRGRPQGATRLLIVGLLFGLAFLYLSILSARGSGSSPLGQTVDVYVEDSWLGELLGPDVINGVLSFYGYFGFGFHYVATYWTEVWFGDVGNFLTNMLPGHDWVTGVSLTSEMRSLIDIGPRWHPDSLLVVSGVGMLGLFLLCFLMGRFAGFVEGSTAPSHRILRYLILLQMISLPVGNFIWADRATLAVTLWLGAVMFLRALGLLPETWTQFLGAFSFIPILGGSRSKIRTTMTTRVPVTSAACSSGARCSRRERTRVRG